MGNLVAFFAYFDAHVPVEWAVIGLVFCSAVGVGQNVCRRYLRLAAQSHRSR
jgi:hypothetical protein